jgi:exopolysaccharide biosynthesis protein
MIFFHTVVILALSICFSCATLAETRIEQPLATGAKYVKITRTGVDGKPLIIHVIRIDRSAKNLSFRPIKGLDHVVGTGTVREMGEKINGQGGEVLATINADFYNMDAPLAGTPCGMIVRNGELMCTPLDWPAFGFDSNGNPVSSNPTFTGSVQIGADSFPVAAVNRVHDKGSELAIFTGSYGPTTFNSHAGTDVVLKDVKPSLPFKAGVTYTGTVSEVRKDVTNDAIPSDTVMLSGNGAASEFLVKNASLGTSVGFAVNLSDEWNSAKDALGCWPRLLRDGKVQDVKPDEYITEKRHARTLIGWNEQELMVVTVDGDDPSSVGLNMVELTSLMQELGCTDAVNLDGGGSTTLTVRGNVINVPADGMDRSVSSGWAVVNSAPAGKLSSIRVVPENISVIFGSHVQYRVIGCDADGNAIQVDPNIVQWSLEGVDATSSTKDPDANAGSFVKPRTAEGELGIVDIAGVFTAAKKFRAGLITAHVGDLSGSAALSIWEKPAGLFVVPAKSKLQPKQRIQLSVMATDRSGRPMVVDLSAVSWHAVGAKVKGDGTLIAPSTGEFKVTAEVAGVAAEAEGVVAK